MGTQNKPPRDDNRNQQNQQRPGQSPQYGNQEQARGQRDPQSQARDARDNNMKGKPQQGNPKAR